jgi:tetratricopeptide (TPR) repeat protein
VQGEGWSAAVIYSRQAGRKALDRSAHREATRWFEQALAALDHLPRSRTSSEQAIDLRFDLREGLQPLMEFARVHRYLDEAQALAEAIDDRSRLAQALSHLVTSAWADGDWCRARELGEHALSLAAEQGEVSLQVGLNFRLGNSLWFSGDYQAAINHFRQNAESLRGNLRHERFGLLGSAAGLSCAFLAACLAERGEFTQAIAFGEDAICIGEEHILVKATWSEPARYWSAGCKCARTRRYRSPGHGSLPRSVTLMLQRAALTRPCPYWSA